MDEAGGVNKAVCGFAATLQAPEPIPCSDQCTPKAITSMPSQGKDLIAITKRFLQNFLPLHTLVSGPLAWVSCEGNEHDLFSKAPEGQTLFWRYLAEVS